MILLTLKKGIFMFACFMVTFTSCKEQQEAKQALQKAITWQLYEVIPFPTEMAEQTKTKQYVADYEVIRAITVSSQQKETLTTQLLNTQNYNDEMNSKRCPFIAKYAIRADSAILVISVSPCAKITWIKPQQQKNLDLVQTNQIEPILATIDK